MPTIPRPCPPAKSEPPTPEWVPAFRVDDAGSDRQSCDRCSTRIRWVHILRNLRDGSELRVGKCCAARLCNDYDAGRAERNAINKAECRKRFCQRERWTQTRGKPGNIWRDCLVDSEKFRVTIFLRNGRFSISIMKRNEEPYFHAVSFSTQADALATAFDLIEHLRSMEVADV
jgi:hypothetical protein